MTRDLAVSFIAVFFITGCNKTDEVVTPETNGNPSMGFAFFPGVFMSSDGNRFITNFNARSNMISIHWSGDVPWALLSECPDLNNCTPSDPGLVQDLNQLMTTINGLMVHTEGFKNDPAKRVYLSMSPLNNERNGVCPNYLQPQIPPPGSDFSNTQVRELYKRFVNFMIAKFQPDYFSQGIEFNMYITNNFADFDNLVSLMEEIKTPLSVSNPGLVTAPTIQWEFYKSSYDGNPTHRARLNTLVNSWSTVGDIYFISTYPNVFLNLTSLDISNYNFGSYGFSFGSSTNIMISECGVQPQFQVALLETVFEMASMYDMKGIIWFFLEDMDALPFTPAFENIGLYDDSNPANLVPQPGLAKWDSYFAGQ